MDRLLRGEVLVDLYRVVRQGLRAGVESYSIKRIEPLYALRRASRTSRTPAAASSRSRRGWSWAPDDPGRGRRERSWTTSPATTGTTSSATGGCATGWRSGGADLEAPRGPVARPARTVDDGAASHGADGPRAARRRARWSGSRRTCRRIPPSAAQDPDADGRWLLAQLLALAPARGQGAWWRFFELLRMTDEELIEEREPLAGLGAARRAAASRSSRSSTRSRSRRRTTASTRTATVTDPVDARRRPATVVRLDEAHADDRAQARPEARRHAAADRARPQRRDPHDGARGEPAAHRRAGRGARPGRRRARRRTGAPDLARRPRPAAADAAGRRSAGTATRPAAGRRRSTPRSASRRSSTGRVLPIQGPPGSGKTYTGRAHDRARSCDGRAEGRRRREQPQGDRQPARDGGRGRRASSWRRARSRARSGSARSRRTGQRAVVRAARRRSRDNADGGPALRSTATCDVVGAVAWTWAGRRWPLPEPGRWTSWSWTRRAR